MDFPMWLRIITFPRLIFVLPFVSLKKNLFEMVLGHYFSLFVSGQGHNHDCFVLHS